MFSLSLNFYIKNFSFIKASNKNQTQSLSIQMLMKESLEFSEVEINLRDNHDVLSAMMLKTKHIE